MIKKLEFKSLELDMSPALLKALHEILNFYFKSKYIASVKHMTLGRFTDRNFLLANIISTSNNTNIEDAQILEVYENPKH